MLMSCLQMRDCPDLLCAKVSEESLDAGVRFEVEVCGQCVIILHEWHRVVEVQIHTVVLINDVLVVTADHLGVERYLLPNSILI